MITLKMTVPLGDIEIAGHTAAEVYSNLQQLIGSDDLLLAWGRVKGQMEAATPEASALGNVGSILGGEAIGASEPYSFDNPPTITLRDGSVAQIQRYIGDGPHGPETKALWYGQNGEPTDNPMDPGILDGSKRYWQWFQ